MSSTGYPGYPSSGRTRRFARQSVLADGLGQRDRGHLRNTAGRQAGGALQPDLCVPGGRTRRAARHGPPSALNLAVSFGIWPSFGLQRLWIVTSRWVSVVSS